MIWDWMLKYVPIICIAVGLFAAIFILASWGVGYYANAMYGLKFELASCKEMMGAIGTGLVGVLMWVVNSVYNSPKGEPPK